MKRFSMQRRTFALAAAAVPLLALFIYVLMRSGPLASVPVVVAAAESRAIAPALFGIGTVEARYTYKVGPTVAGRVKRVEVHAGDSVKAGQLLGEMEPVDLGDRVAAQEAALRRAEATTLAAEAQVQDVAARQAHAENQARRYELLFESRAVSEEGVLAKRLDRQAAQAGHAAARANLDAARQELSRVRADRDGLKQQRANLRLVAPVDGLVAARDADPGTTVVAGQSVVELIDPASLWINVRFDQLRSSGLRAGLPATLVMRSQAQRSIKGRVARVEPRADPVTEELLAKVVFDVLPESLPPVGELAEVTVALAALPPAPVVPNASIQRVDGHLGVWVVEDGALRFAPVTVGASDLDGWVQILDGIKPGAHVVTHSQRALNARSRVEVVERMPGTAS